MAVELRLEFGLFELKEMGEEEVKQFYK